MNNDRLERLRSVLTPISVERAREIARERARVATSPDSASTQDASISVTIEVNGSRQGKRVANT